MRKSINFDPPGLVLAIDPGASGAFAWITASGTIYAIKDMPTIEVRGKRRIAELEVARLMRLIPPYFLVIEEPQAMPRKNKAGEDIKMGTGSTGAFFLGAGILIGCAACLAPSYEIVHPRTWKTRAGVPADKNAARQMAQRIWPECASMFDRKKDDGRADAALLGRWSSLRLRGQ